MIFQRVCVCVCVDIDCATGRDSLAFLTWHQQPAKKFARSPWYCKGGTRGFVLAPTVMDFHANDPWPYGQQIVNGASAGRNSPFIYNQLCLSLSLPHTRMLL